MTKLPESAEITAQIELTGVEAEPLLEEQFLQMNWLRGLACACGAIALAIAATALYGRLSGIFYLASWGQYQKTIVPAMALASILLGAALMAMGSARRIPYGLIRGIGYFTGLIAAVRLLEFFLQVNWGASDLFLPGSVLPTAPDTLPAAWPTASGVLTASLWLIVQRRHSPRSLLFALAGFTTVIGVAFLLGYVYGRPLMYGAGMIPIALPMAVDATIIGIGMLLITAAQEAALRKLVMARVRDGAARLERLSGQLEAVLTAIPDGIAVYDNAGQIIRINQAAMDMLGYGPEHLQLPLRERVALTQPLDWNSQPLPYRETPMARALEGQVTTGFVMRHAGLRDNPPWLVMSAAPLETDGKTQGAVVVFTDITRLRQVEQELLSYQDHLEELVAERTAALETNQQRLRALASELAISEQRERQRLASVMHDELAQSLGMLKLQLSVVRASSDPEETRKQATAAIQMIEDAIRQTRTLMMELSPPVLRQGGLSEALRWWGEQVHERHGLEVETRVNCELGRFDEVLETTVFQSVKELMQNTIKHANATRIELGVECQNGDLIVEVADDGGGFDPNAVRSSTEGGFGLYALRERLAYLSGELDLKSAPGKGTQATLRLPTERQRA